MIYYFLVILRYFSLLICTVLFSYFFYDLNQLGSYLDAKYNLNLEYNFLGFKFDNSDYQWKTFRSNLIILIAFNFVFVFISRFVKILHNETYIINYYFIIGMLYSIVIHGQRFLYLILNLVIYYYLIKVFTIYRDINKYYNRLVYNIFVWLYPCLSNIIIHLYDGFDNILNNITKFQLFPWSLCYNLILLRIISYANEYKSYKLLSTYSLEYNKTYLDDDSTNINKNKPEINNNLNNNFKKDINPNSILLSKCLLEAKLFLKNYHCFNCYNYNVCQNYLINIVIDINYFSIKKYLCYVFYPPLYFSGPIITYNSFIYQVIKSCNVNNPSIYNIIRENAFYILRWFFLVISFEAFNTLIYVNSICTIKHNKNFNHEVLSNNKIRLQFMFIFLLIHIWYKFSIIWKFTRIFALLDNIKTEENINKCVINSYSFEVFWRNWHKSFNQWLIKYIYIPIGGKKTKLLNVWLIFTFVALWHEMKLNLMLWGWSISLFLIPEILIKILNKKIYKKLDDAYKNKDNIFYKVKFISLYIVNVLFGSIGTSLLIISNLIGFGLGGIGFDSIIYDFLKTLNLNTVLISNISYFFIVNISFWVNDIHQIKVNKQKKVLNCILNSKNSN